MKGEEGKAGRGQSDFVRELLNQANVYWVGIKRSWRSVIDGSYYMGAGRCQVHKDEL